MERLFDSISLLVAQLSPSRIEAMAERIRGQKTLDQVISARELIRTPLARDGFDSVIAAWERSTISSDELAGLLLGASYAHGKAQKDSAVELVWTGPTTEFAATRRTEQVLLDLIREAQSELFIVSFVAFDISDVVKQLNRATERGVDVRVLLEASQDHGGSLSVDPVATMRGLVPRAKLYTWKGKTAPFEDGKVHAKVSVADRRTAFLTSANLTGHALEKNMEAGVLFKGGQIPSLLASHLHALIDTNVIYKV